MNTTDLLPIPAQSEPAHYGHEADALLRSFRLGDADALRRAQKFHPRFFKMPEAHIVSAEFSKEDAEMVVALEHGFADWAQFMEHLGLLHHQHSPVARFEAAADAIVAGDAATLETLLRQDQELASARSGRMHRATLLHYIAANGIENYRQQTPVNAPDLARMLLKAGAEPDALANTYGNQWSTTMDLLVSSRHPDRAGVQADLAHILIDHGAQVNGINDDCSPLMTALYFQYPRSAEALVDRGARVDTLAVAAGLGREDLVDQWLRNDGTLSEDHPLIRVPWMQMAENPGANIAQALSWATLHRKNKVLELILSKGVDPGLKDRRDWTPLHWASYCGYPDTVELLLKWNSPLEAENEFGGTVLDQTIWRAVNEELLPTHPQVIEKLIRAGARVGELADWYLRPAQHPKPPELIANILRPYASHQA